MQKPFNVLNLSIPPSEARFSYVWFHVHSPPPLGPDAVKLRAAVGGFGNEKLFGLRFKKGGAGRVSATAHKVLSLF